MSITGRDHFVMCKALAYAIETIEAMPERWQEWSDKDDMTALLNAMTDDNGSYFRLGAQSHIRRRGVDVVDGQLVLAARKSGEVIEGIFPNKR